MGKARRCAICRTARIRPEQIVCPYCGAEYPEMRDRVNAEALMRELQSTPELRAAMKQLCRAAAMFGPVIFRFKKGIFNRLEFSRD